MRIPMYFLIFCYIFTLDFSHTVMQMELKAENCGYMVLVTTFMGNYFRKNLSDKCFVNFFYFLCENVDISLILCVAPNQTINHSQRFNNSSQRVLLILQSLTLQEHNPRATTRDLTACDYIPRMLYRENQL